MRVKIPYAMVLSVLAGLGLAFWAGRASGPGNTVGLSENSGLDSGAAEWFGARHPGRKADPGGGGQAVTSVQQLRGILKNSGSNWETGRAMADAALAKMNGPQLSQLVHSLATAQATTPGYSYRREINAACSRWAEVDPDAALQFVLSNKQASFRSAAISSIFAGVARNDPALASLASLSPAARRAGLVSVIGTMADLDFDAALAKASTFTDPADRKAALALLVGRGNDYYIDRSPEQLNTLLATLPSGSLRNNALNQLGSQLAACSREAAAGILAGYPPKDREKIQICMMQRLSDSDPARAIEIYQTLPPGKAESYIYMSTYFNLAKQDPEAVLRLVADKPSEEQAQVVGVVFAQLARNDPSAATRRLDDYPVGPVRDAAMAQLTSAWAQDDPAAAKAWVATLTGTDQTRAFNALIPAVADTDPKGAADMLGRLLATAPRDAADNHESATFSLVRIWGRDDPEAAGNWTAALPDGNMKNNAISNLASTWASEDFDATGKWIDTLPDGKARDSGVSSMVSATTRRDPATSFAWATTIGDNARRVSMLEAVVGQWKESDPDKARAAVQQADLTRIERDRLLKQIK